LVIGQEGVQGLGGSAQVEQGQRAVVARRLDLHSLQPVDGAGEVPALQVQLSDVEADHHLGAVAAAVRLHQHGLLEGRVDREAGCLSPQLAHLPGRVLGEHQMA
jgi:hypothetical protein